MQEQVLRPKQQDDGFGQDTPTAFSPGDYVELQGLSDMKLNGQKGTINEILSNGRLGFKLGEHLLGRVISVVPTKLRLIAAGSEIATAKALRDNGVTVGALIQQGFSIAALQRDDSKQVCDQCCRPRCMCSCTYDYIRFHHGTPYE